MFRRSVLSFVLALVAILALTVPALAGGVVVTLDTTPTDIRAGVPFAIGFTIISAHEGHDPMTGGNPMIVAKNPATGEQVTGQGKADGAPGHYLASITLPSDGSWDWEVQAWGQEFVMTPLEVRPAAVLPAPVAQSAAAAIPALDNVLWPALVALALMGVLAGGILLRSRRGVEAR